MSHSFFDYNTLTQGSNLFLELIKHCYSLQNRLISPLVQPGFLRQSIESIPPQQGCKIEELILVTKEKIYPGIMLWQSPRYFGYYPSSIAMTNVLAQMFATTFHSPGFNFVTSPSHTELQNITVDWVVNALELPQKFYLRNSGGGIINNSTTESVFTTVHAAKRRKMKELNIQGDDPKILKLVGYYCQISHICAQRGLMMKDIFHKRAIKAVYDPKIMNYKLDLQDFQKVLKDDISKGLIPFWYGSTYGSTFSAGIDLCPQLIQICKTHKIWLNVDAAYLGSSWIYSKQRPQKKLLQEIDSLCINFSKALFLGNGGSLMFIGDKQQFTESMGSNIQFSFYVNKFTGQKDIVDYKDWIVGLNRRNNSLKLYYLFKYYGLNKLRKSISETIAKADYLAQLIQKDSKLFKIFSKEFGLVSFQMLDQNGEVSSQLTNILSEKIKNISEGFLTPGTFKDVHIIRFVIGNLQTTNKQIYEYYSKICQIAKNFQKF